MIFIITWTASIINWLWDNSFEGSKLKRILMVYGIPLLCIISFGQIRLQMDIRDSTVQIASINIEKADLKYHMSDNTDSINARNCANFLQKCDIAALAGSKIVFGAEAIITISEEAEKGFMNRNIRDVLAHLHHWHLMMLGWYDVGMKGEKP